MSAFWIIIAIILCHQSATAASIPSSVRLRERPASSQPDDKKLHKVKSFQKKMMMRHQNMTASRLQGKEDKRQTLRAAQRSERVSRARDDFESRLQVQHHSSWARKYPLSVHCKNFTHVSNRYYTSAASATQSRGGRDALVLPCIPAMVLPIALDPHGFVSRLLSSIDHCVNILFIYKSDEVNLSRSVAHLDRKLVQNIIVRNKPFPITLSHAWNSVRSHLHSLRNNSCACCHPPTLTSLHVIRQSESSRTCRGSSSAPMMYSLRPSSWAL